MQDRTITPGTPGAAPPLPQHNDIPSLAPASLPPQGYADAYRTGSAGLRPAYSNHADSALRRSSGTRQLVTALGWFSIGLGIAQLLAPRTMARAIGAPESTNVMRTVGAREVAAGVGILSRREPSGWLWARVAGDAMDLALIGAAAVLAIFEKLEAIPADPRAWPDSIRSRESLARTLVEHREEALLYRTLATLRTDAPVDASLSALEHRGIPREPFELFARQVDAPGLLSRVTRWAA